MNDGRRAITIAREPRGQAYRALLREALRHCDRFSLVQRNDGSIDASAKMLLSQLAPYLRRERTVTEWPGTKLLGGSAVLREYDLSETSVVILEGAAEGLYDWCQPERLEDLVFWRSSDEPWLVTIAHERDAYVDMSAAEADALLHSVPALSELIDSR